MEIEDNDIKFIAYWLGASIIAIVVFGLCIMFLESIFWNIKIERELKKIDWELKVHELASVRCKNGRYHIIPESIEWGCGLEGGEK